MKCLFLDIASHDGLIALVSQREVTLHRSIHARISDRELLSHVESLLTQGQSSYADLTHSACVTGPGGFMSLRVACACANTLASQLGIPSVGIHLSDLYRARVRAGARNGIEEVYWVHSTKKEQLFVRGGQWEGPTLITLQNFLSLTPTLSFTGELIPEHEKACAEHGFKRAPLLDTLDILPSFLARQEYLKQVLIPWYGRGW